MQGKLSRLFGPALALAFAAVGWAANFGTVVPIHGTVSDIALDERRGRVYAANLSAYRVEIMDVGSHTLLGSLPVSMPPSTVAMSADNRYLLVGEYQQASPAGVTPFVTESGGYVLFDLDGNRRFDVPMGDPVLAVAFGSDGNALILTRTPVPADTKNPGPLTNLFLLFPSSNTLAGITSITVASQDLPVPIDTFPAQIIQAAITTSGDRNTIVMLAATEQDTAANSPNSVIISYDVASRTAVFQNWISHPPLGPRSISADKDATNVMTAWTLFHYINRQNYDWAQLPDAQPGAFNIGTNAWDLTRNLLYVQATAPGDGAVLHIMDTDNLTVRERLQLQENLAGKSVMSSDGNTMYSASISGITVLPIGQLPQTQQVGALEEDLLFTADACNSLIVTRTLDIVSLGSAQTDFTLSLPQGTAGISFSTVTGTTPAQVQVTIDPSVYQGVKGTTAIPVTITSSGAVNLPPTVRLLINTRDFNQRGQIVDIPGKLVDLLADDSRSRLYLLRQDKNLVLVYDMATMQQIGSMRTGNTPTNMAMTTDQRYLIVGNDNSQIANVLDLNTLQATAPILSPGGHYPRTIGVANGGIFILNRNAIEPPDCIKGQSTGILDQVDFANRIAFTPCTLADGATSSIYANGFSTADGVFAPSPDNNYLLLALSDGNVLEYDSSVPAWVASRDDATAGLSGAYGVYSGSLYQAGDTLMDAALVPIGDPFGDTPKTTLTSGAGNLGGWGIFATTTAANGPGMLQRWNTQNMAVVSSTLTAEAPQTPTSLLTPTVGQIGETILSFTRTVAASSDQRTLYLQTISGLTIFDASFDATPPQPQISKIVNSADLSGNVAGGGAINVNGFGLAPTAAAAVGYPLPETLGEVCLTANNIALPLFAVSPNIIVAQLPYITGPANLVIRGPGGISAPFPFTIQGLAPAIFHTGVAGDQTGLAAIYRDDNGEVVDFTNPIHPNLDLTIYLTGLGTATPLPALGAASPSNPLAIVDNTPTVTLGGQSVSVTEAALTPGYATVYQIKVKIPGVVSHPGTAVPLTIQQGTVSTTLQVRVVTP